MPHFFNHFFAHFWTAQVFFSLAARHSIGGDANFFSGHFVYWWLNYGGWAPEGQRHKPQTLRNSMCMHSFPSSTQACVCAGAYFMLIPNIFWWFPADLSHSVFRTRASFQQKGIHPLLFHPPGEVQPAPVRPFPDEGPCPPFEGGVSPPFFCQPTFSSLSWTHPWA